MKQILLIITLILCGMTMEAQTDNVSRKRKHKETTEQTTTTQKKQRNTATKAGKQSKSSSSSGRSASSGSSMSESTSPTRGNPSYTPEVKTYYANGVAFQMVEVRGGTFTMGATPEQGADAWSDEKPAHKVTLSDYYIGKTEVTQALWEAVMGTTVSQIASENNRFTHGVGDNYPMYYISWNDCKEFISKLNALTGKTFRMPTEAEWEYAARGGSKSLGYKYSGGNRLGDVAWYTDNSGDKTHEVGTKSPNELGLYDMSGNVWEWCSDWFGDYSSASQTNPKGPDSGSDRVRRGGSWGNIARHCRCSYRDDSVSVYRYADHGLRLCLSE